LDDLALDEARRRGAVLVVEWGDLVPDAFDDALVVGFEHAAGDARTVTVSWRGSNWEARFVRLSDRLQVGTTT
jgi:tRNA A37 threonylcarbamoyladenosine biosynthesis protein TsaE